ncbi:MAG: ASCH domain-containing protein [Candidatus Nanoarchaeia archaeon]|jgi:hypothetical protein
MKVCDYGNGKLVQIKFDDCLAELFEKGVKTSTTRIEKKAEVGDYFCFKGKRYLVTKITETTVQIACADYYRKEGYGSYIDMLNDLKKFYPDLIINNQSPSGVGIVSTVVYIHEFYQIVI